MQKGSSVAEAGDKNTNTQPVLTEEQIRQKELENSIAHAQRLLGFKLVNPKTGKEEFWKVVPPKVTPPAGLSSNFYNQAQAVVANSEPRKLEENDETNKTNEVTKQKKEEQDDTNQAPAATVKKEPEMTEEYDDECLAI